MTALEQTWLACQCCKRAVGADSQAKPARG
jgi:hypothetical protein